MNVVGSFEAKSKLSELLVKAEQGEEIVITRRGRPVAKLVPITSGPDVEAARSAMRRIRTLAQQMKLGPFEWTSSRDHRR
jgi:prevent-host-death family protein